MFSLIKLIARIEDTASSDVSIKDVRILANSHDPEAIGALAGLLDDDGRVGREAKRALRRFGREAEATLRRCLSSHDERVVAHAEELLGALGERAGVAETESTEVALETYGTGGASVGPHDIAEEVELPPPLAVGNDNEGAGPPNLAMLADSKVTRAIAGTLHKRGIPSQDIDDGVAEVQTRVLEALRNGPPPKTFAEWKTLACAVATRFAIDTGRKQITRARYDVGLCEEPDLFSGGHERHWDPVDTGRMLMAFKEMLDTGELPPLASKILICRMDERTDVEVAAELGLTPMIVFRRREVIRGRFAWKLAALRMPELVPVSTRTRRDTESRRHDVEASVPSSRRR